MNKFITWLFRHSEYKRAQELFGKVTSEYKEAYDEWCKANYQYAPSTNWNHKTTIVEHFYSIESLQQDIKNYQRIRRKYTRGVQCFLENRYVTSDIQPSISDYNNVTQNESTIEEIDGIIRIFELYPRVWKFFSHRDRIEGTSVENIYAAFKELQENGCEPSILDKTIELSQNYPKSWKIFAENFSKDQFSPKCISKANSIPKTSWEKKEIFLRSAQGKEDIIKIIIGTRPYSPRSFADQDLKVENSILKELEKESTDYTSSFECLLKEEVGIKRLILDYQGYGDVVNFVDSFTIPRFYAYRADIDKTGIRFAELVRETKNNSKAIAAYNKSHGSEAVTFIEDYVKMGKKNSPLYRYVVQYNKAEDSRNEIKEIKNNFPLGFKALLGDLDISSISLEKIEEILSMKEQIKQEERSQLEAQKQQELNAIKECVSSWYCPNKARVKCFSLYYYYPTTCDWDASPEEWDIRKLIWNFKANPTRPTSSTEVMRLHRSAVESVVPKIVKCLKHFFGDHLSKLTLVCIPSSKQEVTERRYKDFSSILSEITGMTNGYDYIKVARDGGAKHLGQGGGAVFAVHSDFFKGRYILLFDDVITSGSSMSQLAEMFHDRGAIVVGGLSIGRTRHNREFSNPIDSLITNDRSRFSVYDLPF